MSGARRFTGTISGAARIMITATIAELSVSHQKGAVQNSVER